ncbi:smg6 nonsense mediated mRNA decay factor isoform 1-T1 [Glossina fuscipes fuscipes]
MYRTETREQNDISLIIGNLPKRLQDKFIASGNQQGNETHNSKTKVAENVSTHVEEVSSSRDATVPRDSSGADKESGITAINYFLCLSGDTKESLNSESGPVLENRGLTCMEKHRRADEKYENLLSMPGVIRLNTDDSKTLSESHNTGIDFCNHYMHTLQYQKHDSNASPDRQTVLSAPSPSWINSLSDAYKKPIADLYESMLRMIMHNQILENWQKFKHIRTELQNTFRKLLIDHIKFCCEHKVDSFFWKILFYNVRGYLKQEATARSKKYMISLIEDGLKFYKDLYQHLAKKHLARLQETDNSHETSHRSHYKNVLIAKVTAQKLLICLGDLWRYKIKEHQGQDYSEAAKYYQQAQSLIPSNGIPYNQLAIVSIYSRKKLDAIYFHMRNLMSMNATQSARESLLILFDEIRKKHHESEMKTSPIRQKYRCNAKSSKFMRKEVWIYPDGMRCLHRTDCTDCNGSNYKLAVSEEKRLMEMDPEELLRRIVSLYLYVIGKLFTGVGMEQIQENQRKFILELSVLLMNEKAQLPRSHFLKIVALNIFVLETNMKKETQRYHAFNFCNQIFGVILRKANGFLSDLKDNSGKYDDQSFFDLNTLLQFLRIYTIWLTINVNIWEPVKSKDQITCDCWPELERLFNLIKQENLNLSSEEDILLEEDLFLSGFTPISNLMAKTTHDMVCSEESLQYKSRMLKILDFEQVYVKNKSRVQFSEGPHFVAEDLNSDIKRVLDDLQSTKTIIRTKQIGQFEGPSKEISINNLNEISNRKSLKSSVTDNALDNKISHLTKLKKELEAQSNAKRMYHNKLNEILKLVDTKVYIEVRPKCLLPDTNCFIDCLKDFERILQEFKCYSLVIPLTVIKELDGLSKGVKLNHTGNWQKQRIHHYDDVSTRAKKSLEFIKSSKNYIKCATTKGSIINPSLFALVEEENISNDDKILATAVAMSKTMSSETSSDGRCFIQTELVLITTDRNLRVKALSRNLAVSELPEFLQWAQNCNS